MAYRRMERQLSWAEYVLARWSKELRITTATPFRHGNWIPVHRLDRCAKQNLAGALEWSETFHGYDPGSSRKSFFYNHVSGKRNRADT